MCRGLPHPCRILGYFVVVKIAKGHRVRLKVDLRVVGSDKPLEQSVVEYVHGGGTMLVGLEKVLEGLSKGDKRDGVIKAADAFGNPAMHPTKKMARSEFPKDLQLKVGEKLAAKGEKDGLGVVLLIQKID